MRIALLAFLALAACDESVPAAPAPVAQADADHAAMQGAAERECTQLTGYEPDQLSAMTAEKRALVTREYKSCVDRVAGDN